VKNKPVYGIESVDHALRLAVLLQQEGPLRLTDVAARLGVARSTAHRLLAMLVYRDFAEQTGDRRYLAGPVIRRPDAAEPVAELRARALPHLRALAERCDETVSLQVVVGDQARFVATVEGTQVLRVGDREGRMLPAHLASGGRAILACRQEDDVTSRYTGSPVDVTWLRQELRRTRRRGFAINNQQTEQGVTAIGAAVRDSHGVPVAAVCVAMPTARFSRDRLTGLAQLLATTVTDVEHELTGR